MRMTKSVGYAVALATGMALLAACSSNGGSTLTGGAPAAGVPEVSHNDRAAVVNGVAILAAHPDANARTYQGGVVSPDKKKKKNVLYQWISNFDDSIVGQFDYPKGDSMIGLVNQGAFPQGECADVTYGIAKETFWVVESGWYKVYEYSYKGGSPIAELSETIQEPDGCAMDPKSGNLAVTLYGEGANVVIFSKGSGSGTSYRDGIGETYFAGYDDRGNLYVDGLLPYSHQAAVAELPSGASSFVPVTLSNTLGSPGGVQYDGKYMTFNDQDAAAIYGYKCSGTSSGTSCTLKQTVSLSGSSDCVQTWIGKGLVYCPDAGNNVATVYKYPAGGPAIATLSGSYDHPVGAVVVAK
jgi:hypothetical protein